MLAAPRLIARLRRRRQGLIAPVVLILITSGLIIAGLLYIGARIQDRTAITASVHLADVTFQAIHRDLGRLAKDYTWWDDAIESLLLQFDPQWADDNIGWYLADTFGTDTSLVLSGDDRVIYSAVAGVAEQDFDLERIGTGFNAILQEARSSHDHELVPATGFILVDEDIHFAAISPYVSEYEDRPPQTPDPDAVLLLTKRLDGELLAQISTDYRLPDLRVTAPDSPRTAASLELRTADGTLLGVTTWNPVLPGQSLIASVLPGLAGALLVTIGLLRLFIGRAQRAAKALQERARRLQAMTDNVPGLVFQRLQHPDGRISYPYMSPATRRIHGLDPEAVMADASVLIETQLPEDRAKFIAAAKESAERLTPMYTETRHLGPDGFITWVESVARPHRLENGAILWDGISLDVTERKKAESDAMRLGQALEDSPIEIYFIDLDSHRFLEVNRAARENLGYSIEELKKMTPADVGPNFDPARMKSLTEMLTSGEQNHVRYETVNRRKDGSDYLIELRLELAQYRDTAAILGIGEDVTVRKKVEEQLRQAQKLEAVGQLTGGLAHDFNNLLSIIMTDLEMLEPVNEVQNELIKSSLEATGRAAELTKRLLAFSRKQALRPETTDVNVLIKGMMDLLVRTLGETIDVGAVLCDELWNTTIDRGQLEVALLNLAINSRDAMPRGGRLTIESENATLDEDYAAQNNEVTPGPYVMLVVSDTGTGMPAEIMAQVFEPFFTTKEVGAGSGLGLSMVYGFVKQSGGHITISSEIAQGTTVKIYLPRAVEAAALAGRSAPDEFEPRGNGEIILVVEDDADVRKSVVRLLSNLGYRTIEAGNGEEALVLLDQTPEVSLLFTDIVLPGDMSGVELTHEAYGRSPRLKVLYTSGYSANAIIRHGCPGNGVDLIEKPYRTAHLARKVRTALGQQALKAGR